VCVCNLFIQHAMHMRRIILSSVVWLAIQPLVDLREGCFPRNLTQVEFYVSRNFPKLFNSIQCFISRVGKITKQCFEMYNKKIKTTSSTYFCRPSWVLHLFLRNAKYVSKNFLSFLRPAKIYLKLNLLKSSIT
jgi:hypothetical protein